MYGSVVFNNTVADPRSKTLFKKRLRHRCFPVNFAKFLRKPIFACLLSVQNTVSLHVIKLFLQNSFAADSLTTLSM